MQNHSKETTNSEEIVASETKHLHEIQKKIRAAVSQASALLTSTEGNYNEVKSYMASYRGEIDPSELYQNELFLKEVDQQSEQAFHAKDRLEKLLDSPYFARVVFAPDLNNDRMITYIGRFAFSHENRMLISDWRSPVAGLFYDFEIGQASYDTPSGTITGKLLGKRQFKIEQGRLMYAVDSASSVRDEVLQQELSKTSDQKMRSIISSIQKEQNRIIRDESTDTLIIQGVAGSGKTSIALHRVAYLLYRRKEKLSSKSVAILSPNKVFGNYISNVLPELGEEPISEIRLQDIFEHVLDTSLSIERARSPIDNLDPAWEKRAQYKGSSEFAQALIEYLEKIPSEIFKGQDLTFAEYTAQGSWLEERFYRYGNIPLNERLDKLASDVSFDLSSKRFRLGAQAAPPKQLIRKKLERMLKARDALTLYQQFYRDNDQADMLYQPSKQTIEWEDACPLVFFEGAFDGLSGYSDILHLVVDEMQDLTPIQHMMIARLFTCEKTILGDFYQMVDPNNRMSLESMQPVYPNAQVFKLVRSYRSTREIMNVAKKVKFIPELESIARHGEEPRILACGNTLGVLENLDELISSFRTQGHKTLGILHKSDALAQRYYELLARDHDLHLISPDSSSFENGVSIASVKSAKGLEFDEIILLDVESQQYSSEYDRSLLYVAITRAMHKLTILYRNELTGFLV